MVDPEDSAAVLAGGLATLLDDWPAARRRVHLPAPRGLGGSQAWFHFHVYPEFFWQLGGHTEFHFPEGRLRLPTGHLLIVPRLLPHNEFNYDGHEPFGNLVAMPNGRHLGLHIARRGDGPKVRAVKRSQRRFASDSLPTVVACCDEASRLLHDPDLVARPEAVDSLLHSALLSLEALLSAQLQRGERPQSRIERCLDLIEMNLGSQQLSVGELARWLACHPDHLSARFRRERGCTVIGHINERRIDLARRLLRDGDLRVAEVAWACGFSDPAYFSRRFKRHTGHSPQGYREESVLG